MFKYVKIYVGIVISNSFIISKQLCTLNVFPLVKYKLDKTHQLFDKHCFNRGQRTTLTFKHDN